MTTVLDPILSPQGRTLLDELTTDRELLSATPLVRSDMLRRRGVDPALVAPILTQLELRLHARTKFGELANSLIFTRDGLEQATRRVVSTLRARRFAQAGAHFVADLGCGIGSDSVALAQAGMSVLAVDRDEEALQAASANLRAFPTARVLRADVLDLDIGELTQDGVDALFADPARRTSAGATSAARRATSRVLDPNSWSPPLATVMSWREHIPTLGVKVAPGIAHRDLPSDACVEWTSVDGALVEAAIWTGSLAHEGPGRRAQVIAGNTVATLSEEAPHLANSPIRNAALTGLSDFIGEPDDAVIRSGLVARLAEELDAGLISESIAYLSAAHPTPTPFLSWCEVVDCVALKPKVISQALRSLGVGSVEIKKRGADIDPQVLRRSLRLDGQSTGVVFATRVKGRHRAIIARRIPATS